MIRLSLAMLLLLLPSALADPASEAQPGCEEDQPWIFYGRTEPIRRAYEAQGAPGGLALCEGEHWDGQDSVSSEPATCTPMVTPDPAAPHASMCLGPDPNAASGHDVLSPAGVRLSSRDGSVYVAANVALVLRSAVYADGSTVAVYVRDNTMGNVIVTLIGSWSPIPPYVSEQDCDQATYQQEAMTGQDICGRDNTAVTFEHGLLA